MSPWHSAVNHAIRHACVALQTFCHAPLLPHNRDSDVSCKQMAERAAGHPMKSTRRMDCRSDGSMVRGGGMGAAFSSSHSDNSRPCAQCPARHVLRQDDASDAST